MRRKAAIIGGGVIVGGWAARFLLNGRDVAVFDPDPEAERKIGEVIANARRSLPAVYDKALPAEEQPRFHADLAEAVAGVDWVQESVPERLDLKHKVLGALCAAAPASAVIGSSTSGFKPSELNGKGARGRDPALDRNVPAGHPQGDRRAYRRPPAGSGLARVAVAGEGRRRHDP